MLLEFLQAFVLLTVIMDPLVSVVAFISMTRNMDEKGRKDVARKAVIVAAIPLFLFLFGGNLLLQILDVDIGTFKAAGGLILILLGIQLSLGVSLKKKEEEPHEAGAIAAIIGTPLLTGPATISATIILTNEMGMLVTAMAGLAALSAAFVTLAIGEPLMRRLGVTGARVLSTMLGLITIAWGMSFIKEGLLTP